MLTRTTHSIAALALTATLVTTVEAQSTMRVTAALGGGWTNDNSYSPSISADGRFVAFQSIASNLVPGDTNGCWDIFVHDAQSGQTARVSVDSAGNQANSSSYPPSISGNGRFVAFYSAANNLVSGGVNGYVHVYLHDMQTQQTTCASVDSNGTQGNNTSYAPSISADGRFVAFYSWASNLVMSDTNNVQDVFVHDAQTGQTTRVSVDSGATQGNLGSYAASISADGRFVAFESDADNLVPGDVSGFRDVFIHDIQTGQTACASVNSSGAQGNFHSNTPSISADGRFVAFQSAASNLVTGDSNSSPDIFVHDMQTGQTARVSVDSGGTPGNNDSYAPSISADGGVIAFYSLATNLVPGDTNGITDVFLHDMQSGATLRVSVTSAGTQGNNTSLAPSVNADGRLIAFQSDASNLEPGDINGYGDVFVRDWWHACYLDSDLDGFGVGIPLHFAPTACGSGYSPNASDCDDTLATVHPGAIDVCNGIDDDCDGVIDNSYTTTYCTAGTTVHGCVPSISGLGAPSSNASSGFDIVVQHVEGNRMGLIFYGFYPAAVQWAPNSPSFRCVSFPTQRTPTVNSGGTLGQCNGMLSIDFNAWIQANQFALGYPFVAGQVFYAQGWFRDSGAPKGTNLSDGLRFTLCN